MRTILSALCLVLAVLCCAPPVVEAGPVLRGLSAPFRGARALAARRLERRANGELPRQRVARSVAYGFGGGCAGGSCGQ